jgi:sortase A
MGTRMRVWLGRLLLVAGVVLLGYWTTVTLDSRAYQARLARLLEVLEHPGTSAAAAARHEARMSGLVGRIRIPRLGISALVAEGTTTPVLQRAVGHLEGTPFPGEWGNVVLAGHRDTYFSRLRSVTAGDLIRIETADGTFTYRVDSILIVPPDRNDLLDNTGDRVLTLVTCYPFHWIGPAPRRFVVRARGIGAPRPLTAALQPGWSRVLSAPSFTEAVGPRTRRLP